MVLGGPGEKAIVQEPTQFKDMDAFFPIHSKDLTKEQRIRSLSSLVFLMENCDCTVKEKSCATKGNTHRSYIKKEDAATPTATTESVLITAAINAPERHDVTIYDIPTVFLHAETNEDIVVKIEGSLVKLMVKIDPSFYQKYFEQQG